MLNIPRPWIIGDGANNADGAQGLVMGHKSLVMGQRPFSWLGAFCRL